MTKQDHSEICKASDQPFLGIAGEIESLWHDKKYGYITEDEYNLAKTRLINAYPTAPLGVGREAQALYSAWFNKALTQDEYDAAKKQLLAYCDDSGEAAKAES